jgi:hypothetical protein
MVDLGVLLPYPATMLIRFLSSFNAQCVFPRRIFPKRTASSLMLLGSLCWAHSGVAQVTSQVPGRWLPQPGNVLPVPNVPPPVGGGGRFLPPPPQAGFGGDEVGGFVNIPADCQGLSDTYGVSIRGGYACLTRPTAVSPSNTGLPNRGRSCQSYPGSRRVRLPGGYGCF